MRITVEIGAFRFVCTNMAVGGGGIFAAGFHAVHAGEISVDRVRDDLERYLSGFDRIMETYRYWIDHPWTSEDHDQVRQALRPLGQRHAESVPDSASNRYVAYNRLTNRGTHHLRTADVAFRFLSAVNHAFQSLN